MLAIRPAFVASLVIPLAGSTMRATSLLYARSLGKDAIALTLVKRPLANVTRAEAYGSPFVNLVRIKVKRELPLPGRVGRICAVIRSLAVNDAHRVPHGHGHAQALLSSPVAHLSLYIRIAGARPPVDGCHQ